MDNFDERVQAYLKDWEEFKDLKLTHKKLNDLQQRIDKAVEYCNNNIEFTPRLIDVIDILKGDDTND